MNIFAAIKQYLENFFTPKADTGISVKNYRNVQIDALGVGLANAASPFLPVFLTRLGASSFEISLLSSMPAVAGLLIAIPMGRFLQNQKNIVAWFSTARLLVVMGYAMTGIIAFLIPRDYLIFSILAIWALLTIPQTLLSICFTVVMNSVAGPVGRYDLMSRRWSILGITTAISVFLIGQILDKISFPHNYTIVFIGLSLGGWISYFFSRQIEVTTHHSIINTKALSLKEQGIQMIKMVRSEKPFLRFVLKRFVYTAGGGLSLPLFTIYLVRVINASDSWIAIINTVQTAILFIGYFIWARQSKAHGSRLILLASTFGLALYPIMTALTHQVWLIAVYAGTAGIFSAGINLVFFDELLKTVPTEHSATFVSISQSFDYLATVISPVIGSYLGLWLGIPAGLIISGSVRIIGTILFALGEKTTADPID